MPYVLFFGPNFQKTAKATRQPAYARYLSFCFFSEIRNKLRQPGNQVLRTIYIIFMESISRNQLRQPGNQHLRGTYSSYFFHKLEISKGNQVLRTMHFLFFGPNFQKSAKATRQPAYERYPSFYFFQKSEISLGNQTTRFCTQYIFCLWYQFPEIS